MWLLHFLKCAKMHDQQRYEQTKQCVTELDTLFAVGLGRVFKKNTTRKHTHTHIIFNSNNNNNYFVSLNTIYFRFVCCVISTTAIPLMYRKCKCA